MSRRTPWPVAAFLLAPLVLVNGCGKANDPWKDVEGGPTRILASFPPLYCFAKQVAGPHAAVMCLAPTVGPHHYEPTVDDPLKADKAHLILYNGLGLDDEKIVRLAKNSRNKNVELIPVAFKSIDERQIIRTGPIKHGGHFPPAGPDPHVWLGVEEARHMVFHIHAQLARLDPEHAEEFHKRSTAYVARLDDLKDLIRTQAKVKRAKLISMHESLGYFARTFQKCGVALHVIDALQVQPGIEGDIARFKKIIDDCEAEKGGRFIITIEPQYPRAKADDLLQEMKRRGIDARIAVVDTIETADPAQLTRDPANPDADFYLNTMRQNILSVVEHLQ